MNLNAIQFNGKADNLDFSKKESCTFDKKLNSSLLEDSQNQSLDKRYLG